MKNIFYIFVAILSCAYVYGQETTGTLQGILEDSNKLPISFATITVTDTETNYKYGVISQENGFYSFTNLPPGNSYTITVSFLGYKTITEPFVEINLGAATIKNFVLIEENETLDEVVLTTKAEKQKKWKRDNTWKKNN